MPVHSRLIIMALFLTGCSMGEVSTITVKPEPKIGTIPGSAICKAEQPCELIGTVTIVPRAANRSYATLVQNGTACIPLLLSDSMYDQKRRWNGKRVRVRGTALERGPDDTGDPDSFIDRIQYRDRWLSPATCAESRMTLYVDELSHEPMN